MKFLPENGWMKASPGYIDGWGQPWRLSLTLCLPRGTWVWTRGWRGQVRTFQHSLHICHVVHVSQGRSHVYRVPRARGYLSSPPALLGAAEVQNRIGFPEIPSSIFDSSLQLKERNSFTIFYMVSKKYT